MPDTRVPKTIFFAILFAGLVQCLHDFPLLPDRLASHFDAAGNANGWMTNPQFCLTYAVMLVPTLAVEFWVSRRIARTRENRLRPPNKEHWLAPERRAETFAYFGLFFAWYGARFCCLWFLRWGWPCAPILALLRSFRRGPSCPRLPRLYSSTLWESSRHSAGSQGLNSSVQCLSP